jgi:hypothetical protein
MYRLSPLALLLSCSGSDGETDTFTRPETCDDGVDNNDNGLVDCADTAFCGGLQCQTGDDDDDTDVPLPDLEIIYDPTTCCDFQFVSGDCPKSIGTIGVINRSTDDATVDASCDFVTGESVIQWQVQGGAPPIPFIVAEPLYSGQSMTLEGFFNCDTAQPFNVACRVKVETDIDVSEVEFDIEGTPAG